MEYHSSESGAILGGCLIPFGLLVLIFVFPPLGFILGLMWLYWQFKRKKRFAEIDQYLDRVLSGMTRKQIEKKRKDLIDVVNNPYSEKVDVENAKYAIKYIEQKYLRN